MLERPARPDATPPGRHAHPPAYAVLRPRGISIAGLLWLSALTLSAGGFGVLDLLLVSLFAVTLPWTVIGFWNATIGLFVIMRSARDPAAEVMPAAGRVRGDEPITAPTAILMCVRNEPPERVVALSRRR